MGADEAELLRVRDDLGRDPLVLTAPKAEAERVVRALEVEPRVEVLLAAVRFPPVDRGHRLDELVRGHALRDHVRAPPGSCSASLEACRNSFPGGW